jgi:hypothetical protein
MYVIVNSRLVQACSFFIIVKLLVADFIADAGLIADAGVIADAGLHREQVQQGSGC